MVTSYHYYNSSMPNVDWDDLNGNLWRTKFDPPLTYFLSSVDDGMYKYGYGPGPNFGVSASPANILIGPDNTLLFNEAGFSVPMHLEHAAVIDEGLGLLSPTDVVATINGSDIDLTWSYTEASERYSFVKFNLYRNGTVVQEITDSQTLSFKDIACPVGNHVYQMTVTYVKNDNADLEVESMRTTPGDPLVMGDLGTGEWMMYGTDFVDELLGLSREFAYAVEFDFGSDEYLLKAIEVIHRDNGEVEWAVAQYGKGLVQNLYEGELLGNTVVGDLSGYINVFEGMVPSLHVVSSTQVMTGHVAIVIISDGNPVLASPVVNALADHTTDENVSEWTHLTELGVDYIWYLRMFVENVTTKKSYEISPSGVVEI